jgi:predicted nucleic acid-binding Zn ribbon protein
MEQVGKVTSVTSTASGEMHWFAFAESHPELTLLGWAHSHHQIQLIPQRRLPSQVDVDMQFQLQNQNGANLMLILNEDGWTAWTLPHPTVQLMRQNGNTCCHPDMPTAQDLVQNATFLTFEKKDERQINKHVLGNSVLPSSSCVYCKMEIKDKSKFCSDCGSAQSKEPAKCPNCKAASKPDAKFCSDCGSNLKPDTS